jgi:RHS repeat-associated protein
MQQTGTAGSYDLSSDYRYGYNGKEKDDEIKGEANSLDYGARIYDPRVGRWMSTDPLESKYPSMSAYNYCLDNPISNIDPDGAEVYILFNKTKGRMYMIDIDHFQNGLPIKVVSAKYYIHGGVRDDKGKLTHNQVLVLDNVFSGGESDIEGNLTRNLLEDKDQLPIPNGSYDLLEYEADDSWYKLDPIDESRYDDHHQGYENADGETRNGYRWHLGRLSHGCVTVCDPNGNRQDEWNVVGKILENTSKTVVPKREGRQKYIPFTSRLKFGTVKVEGSDSGKIKEVKKEENKEE